MAQSAYLALFALQHRGQESCGIAVNDDGVFTQHRGDGLVPDVFTPDKLNDLGMGNMAIGHVRYSTTGGKTQTMFNRWLFATLKVTWLLHITAILLMPMN